MTLVCECVCVCEGGVCSEDEEEEVLSCEGGKKSRKVLKGDPDAPVPTSSYI